MSKRRSISLLISTGDLRLGEWCPVHNLPHGYSCDVYMLGPDGVTNIGTYDGCDE